MKTVITLSNQRLIDIAMQELGDVSRLYELCLLNDLTMTAELEAGTKILVPDFETDKRRIVNLFSNTSLAPASADDLDAFAFVPPGGIGFMQVGGNFIVS